MPKVRRLDLGPPPAEGVHPTMAIRPVNDRCVVRRHDPERKTASGIVIPHSAGERPEQGQVLAAELASPGTRPFIKARYKGAR